MGKVIMSGIVPPLKAPITGILLSNIAEGSIVKLNEGGSPIEFYVAKHDYESALNGTGRTLIVRKDCYNTRRWCTSGVNTWESSNLRSWLNSDYLDMLDEDTRLAISTTKYYYTTGNGSYTVNTRSDAVFMLSATELGKTATYVPVDGTVLPITSTLQIAYHNGSAVPQWTRSPSKSDTYSVCYLDTNGGVADNNCAAFSSGNRPCFTLPSTALFDEETLILKGVA